MQSKNILFLSSWFPDRITRSNGDFVKRHARTAAMHHRVVSFFVRFDPGLKKGREIIEEAEGNYTEIIVYFGLRMPWRFLRLLKYISNYIRGYTYIKQRYFSPDLIHANIIFPVGMVAWTYHKLFRCPYVISEHWSLYLPFNNGMLSSGRKRLDAFIVRHAACMLPVTRNMGESLQELGYKNRYEVLPNVVQTSDFKPGDRTGIKKFIHLSTLNDRTKNISGMMRAVKKLSTIRQDFTVELIGLEAIEKHTEYARRLGILGKYVIVHPEIEHHEVPDRLRKSMSLLMFSNFESLPCVIIEALASGIPVISSDVGGIKEYISEREGILVPPGDEEKLTEAMQRMLDHQADYDPEHLRTHAMNNFSPEAIIRIMDTIYQSVIPDA